jgi:hypothetical protein
MYNLYVVFTDGYLFRLADMDLYDLTRHDHDPSATNLMAFWALGD